jgi:hypothetical protein
MAVNDETRSALREMGLNAYEIDTYLALLEGGQMSYGNRQQATCLQKSTKSSRAKRERLDKTQRRPPFKYYPVPRESHPHNQTTP